MPKSSVNASLSSYDDIFSTEESRQEEQREQVQQIPHSVRAAEISAAGKSIFVHDPKGKVAEAYKSLTKEVLADAEKQRKRQSEQLR